MKAANDNQPGPTTPLRLTDALQYGFPNGGMTLSGLRREIAKGRLSVERIAGKQFTTLSAIEEMRKLCRESPEAHTSMKNPNVVQLMERLKSEPVGSSETGKPSIAQAALSRRLSERKKA